MDTYAVEPLLNVAEFNTYPCGYEGKCCNWGCGGIYEVSQLLPRNLESVRYGAHGSTHHHSVGIVVEKDGKPKQVGYHLARAGCAGFLGQGIHNATHSSVEGYKAYHTSNEQ